MAMRKIKTGDQVIVLSGKDKGRSGAVLKVLSNQRVIVEGINLITKHVRPNPDKQEKGGMIERESGLHISNIALMNPLSKKADRIGFRVLSNGKKVRYYKSNNEVVDV